MYNKATNALWITYHNAAGVGTYFKGTITIYVNGSKTVIGDQEPVFIDRNQLARSASIDVVRGIDDWLDGWFFVEACAQLVWQRKWPTARPDTFGRFENALI